MDAHSQGQVEYMLDLEFERNIRFGRTNIVVNPISEEEQLRQRLFREFFESRFDKWVL